ncbi:uncharacterized protein T26G10.4-like [Harmonia axyridis]|uniref:uncharacterized protein T26G10.4-like n=1 Tax=Harmonia axyridis TaxID=115357 RepID=UPI001E27860D|nr:uncharacterized protein T26G10.4-like [Harmonia axyridis]
MNSEISSNPLAARRGGFGAAAPLKDTNDSEKSNNNFVILAYADDLVLVSDTPEDLQIVLDCVGETAAACGLTFKPGKCASLTLDCRRRHTCRELSYSIQGKQFPALEEGQAYEHLGIPTGYHVDQSPEDTIDRMTRDLQKLDESLLAPWQKIDALSTFILPRVSFVLRGCHVQKSRLGVLDKRVKRALKSWMNLPQRASPEILYVPMKRGGAGILPMTDLVEVASIVQAFKMLTCPEALVRDTANSQLREVVQRRIGRVPSVDDLARYLSGDLEGEFGRDGGDISSLWSRARNATRRLSKRLEMGWTTTDSFLSIQIGGNNAPDGQTITRQNLEWRLKDAVRNMYASSLCRKPDQGKTFKCFSRSAASNHFTRSGFATRFCDWRFIHRARLDCVPLNATRRFGSGDRRCRRCQDQPETLPHVLNHCRIHSAAWQKRHNAVQDRLVKSIPDRMGTVHVNRQVPLVASNLRPDIVIVNEMESRVAIIDVTIPFENEPQALIRARELKLEKYAGLAEDLRARGFETTVDALIVGALGTWDQENEAVLRRCGTSLKYATLMRRLMCSDVIRWSRDIYIEHVTGVRQYT